MYFKIENRKRIESIEDFVLLSKKHLFGKPGVDWEFKPLSKPQDYVDNSSFETTGLFRGQSHDWKLIPSSYRDKEYKMEDLSDVIISFDYSIDNLELSTFVELASQQNQDFPKSEVEQMVIAQHYGIKTPLLDWTKNIFVAAYFALDLRTSKKDPEKYLEPYIYHIRDERLLGSNAETITDISTLKTTSLVSPLPIDRRVERQFSMFTLMPHPHYRPKLISVDEYQVSGKVYMELWEILKGMGFSSAHYFPDYAGLASRIKQGYII